MSYFEDRVLKDKVRSVNLSEDYIKTSLKKAYKVALKDIDKDINSLYEKLAKKEKISLNNAMDKLSKKEKLKELDRLSKSVLEERKTFEDIKDGLDESLRLDLERNLKFMEKNLSMLSKTGYISHLELLKTNIENRVLKLSNENQINIYEHLKEQYMDGYFSGVFNITKELGFSYSFASPDERVVKRLITSDWKGSNYSKRLYKNTQILAKELKDVVTTSLIRGESIDKMSRNLVARTEVSSYRARTLVRTEAAYIHEMSTYDAYKESGIEKYRYLATLDRRTSKICQELDGKVFEIDKKEIGVNYPPMHPNCRSTTIAYIEGMKGQRLARGSAGKNYEVPADMTYKQWHDNLSENEKGKMKLLNKKDRNATKDKAEYDKYKQVLGKDMPSLARFKDLKYTDELNYKSIKQEVKKKEYVASFEEKLKKGEINTKVQWTKALEHTQGTKAFENRQKQAIEKGCTPHSYVYKDIDHQKIVDEYKGKGDKMPHLKDNTIDEYVTLDTFVGEYYNLGTKKYEKTKRICIKYTNKGTHIYPVKEKENS